MHEAAAGFDELAVAAWWRDHQAPLVLEDGAGHTWEIIHRGAWSHRLGPDFVDALVLLDGRELISGAIELHLHQRGWYEHGHHLDAAYNNVVLHAILYGDLKPVRLCSGGSAQTVRLLVPDDDLRQYRATTWHAWSLVGGDICAPDPDRQMRHNLIESVTALGDLRLASKTARAEAELSILPAGEVLLRGMLEALGYSENREPMRRLAEMITLQRIEQSLAGLDEEARFHAAAALLYGAGGFLPFSPVEANLANLSHLDVQSIEQAWYGWRSAWQGLTLAPSTWRRTRTRPANHPVIRIAMAARILANASAGLLPAMLDSLRSGDDPVAALIALSGGGAHPPLGQPRAIAVMANAVLPVTFAYAGYSGDDILADAAARAWSELAAAEMNAVTKRAAHQVSGNEARFPRRERVMQGLIHLDQVFCGPRRCFECPVARLVVEQANQTAQPQAATSAGQTDQVE